MVILYSAVPECRDGRLSEPEKAELRHKYVWKLLDEGLYRRGYDKTRYTVEYSANGKPYFKENGSPFFSLSHTSDMVACAISDREVGCDIETVHAVPERVQKRFLGKLYPSDIEAIKGWTELESYVKMYGLSMKKADFSLPHAFRSFDIDKCVLTVCTYPETVADQLPDAENVSLFGK